MPLLATVDPPDQTERQVASRQCAEASGYRVLLSHNGKGSISAANGGGRNCVTFFLLTSREGLRQVYDDMYKFLLVTNFGGR